jgi:hypothetical protein
MDTVASMQLIAGAMTMTQGDRAHVAQYDSMVEFNHFHFIIF